MRFRFFGAGIMSVAILSLTIGVILGRTSWSVTTALLARAEEPTTKSEIAAKEMTPVRALAIAIKTLADRKIELFERYKIEMTPDENEWGIWFIGLPESPGMFRCVTVTNDGRTSVASGK
jgi:hypothetical protein